MDVKKDVKKYEDIVAACNRCGFCTSYCPTYNATGNEAHSPRGRNQLFRALIEGKVSDPAQARESIEGCLLCGECTSVCFSEVPTAQLMVAARDYLNKTAGVPWALKFFLRKILPYPKRYQWLLRAAFLGKNLGISAALRKSGLLKRFSPELDAADALLTEAPMKFLSDMPVAKRKMASARNEQAHSQALKGAAPAASLLRPQIAYMPVCGSQYLRPRIGAATLALFERMKVDMVIPDVVCCGLPAASYGVMDDVRALAKANIERIESGRYEAVLVDDSSCAAHLKELPSAFEADPAWLKRAHAVSQKFRDLPSTLIQRGLKEHLKLAPWAGGKVAYHDPCKAQYALRLTAAPRELLAAIPRLDLVPVSDADQCCGGAGTYSFVHPEMSQAVLAAKVKNIIASGCSIVVTSSASCQAQIASGLRAKGSNIEVLHLSEFLLRAIERRK